MSRHSKKRKLNTDSNLSKKKTWVEALGDDIPQFVKYDVNCKNIHEMFPKMPSWATTDEEEPQTYQEFLTMERWKV